MQQEGLEDYNQLPNDFLFLSEARATTGKDRAKELRKILNKSAVGYYLMFLVNM